MPRIGKIFDFLEKEHLDCVVIKDVNTIRYLTGFRGDSSILYADDRRAVLVTDGRYLYQARAEAKCCHIVEYAENIWHTVAELAQDAKQLVLTAIISLIMTSILCRSFYAAKN